MTKTTTRPRLKPSEAIVAWILYWLTRLFWLTYRVSASGLEHRAAAESRHPLKICGLASWHEHILCTVSWLRGQRLTTMASRSKDGRIAAYTLHRNGYEVAYGSSSRGGRDALREMLDHMNLGMTAAIAVDGPRGPRHEVKPGIVEIARRTRCEIVPVAWAADRAWRARSWDRFVIPKPFARVHMRYGPGIAYPDPETDNAFAETQAAVAAALERVEREAAEGARH